MYSMSWKDGLHQHWKQLDLAGEPKSMTPSVKQPGGAERGRSPCRMLWCPFSSAEPATEGVGVSSSRNWSFQRSHWHLPQDDLSTEEPGQLLGQCKKSS